MLKTRLLLSLLSIMLVLGSCGRKEVCNPVTATATSEEIAKLRAFVTVANPNAVFDSRGFYYEIIKPGTSNHPNACSDLYLNYEGSTTDGQVFMKSGNISENMYFDLSKQIYGWRYAIPMIGMGSEMRLYLPPSLAQGNESTITTKVPPGEIVVYYLKLIRYN